jgi:hypothetical protein
MVSVSATAERDDGVTLVEVVAEAGDDGPRQVRVRTDLDGPVWPPRRRGVPEARWDADDFEVVLEADETRVRGFATPALPEDPLVRLVHSRPVETASPDATAKPAPRTPDAVVRRLGNPVPPRDAVPIPEPGPVEVTDERGTDFGREIPQPADPPAGIDVDAAERRLALAECLAAVETIDDATAALGAVGGIDGAISLARAVERDREHLSAVAGRARELADRAASVDVPVDTFETVT